VGSLRGDFTGDGALGAADKAAFLAKWRAGDLDADFRGVGFGVRPPDGRITLGDIDGFTSAYLAGVAAGRGLNDLPTGGPLSGGVTELADLGGVDILAAAAGQILPPTAPASDSSSDPLSASGVSGSATDLLQVRKSFAATSSDPGLAVLRL
ncbi:MAG: hypothetical protein NT049_14700, partial [Planctomycetota bacterium]|nr:hypothetical protein [Planctomycetota bacterium]